MATVFFPTTAAQAAALPAGFTGTQKLLSLSRGAGVTSIVDSTVAGLSTDGSSSYAWGGSGTLTDFTTTVLSTNGFAWVSNPLNAVTIGTAITINLRGLESSAMANYGVGCVIYKSVAGVLTIIAVSALNTELGTAEAARNFAPIGSATLADGDRLVAVPFWIGVGGSASGFTATGFYAGTGSGASGDTFVSFTETITELSPHPFPIRVVSQAQNRAANW